MAVAHGSRVVSPVLADDIADQLDTVYQDATAGKIAVVDGANISVGVRYGQLTISDGAGVHRRERRWSRPNAPERIVILSRSGHVSMHAIGWAEQTGTHLVAIDPKTGRVRFMTMRGTPDGRIHQAQAIAATTDVGFDLAREWLAVKIRSQAGVARELGGDPAIFRVLADGVEHAETIAEAVGYESAGANAYWPLWTDVQPRFIPSAARQVPSHWLRWNGRASEIGNSNQRATTPVTATLHYATALAKTEVHAAILAMGMSPHLGIVHANGRDSDAFVSDMLEPLRGAVEHHVVGLFRDRTWKLGSFLETPTGEVRLGPALRHELARGVEHWRKLAAPWAEHAAARFAELIATNYQPTRPLTGKHRRAAAARVRARRAASEIATTRATQPRPNRRTTATWACPDCGNSVGDRNHVRCMSCIDADPQQTPRLRQARARAIASRKQTEATWARLHPEVQYDPGVWDETIRPALATMKLSAITAATGVTKSTASSWRAGKTRAHIAHWQTLIALTEARNDVDAPSPFSRKSR